MRTIAWNFKRMGRALIRYWWRIPVLVGVLATSLLLNHYYCEGFNPGHLIAAGLAPGLVEWWVATDERASDKRAADVG
ncbi:hypothetical protein [Crossiella sp. NPDC003009]